MSATKGVAVITGGNSGIGYGAAKALAAAGWSVVISGRDLDRLKAAKDSIAALGGEIDTCAFDVTQSGEVKAGFKTIADRYGRIDVLVNSAGGNTRLKTWSDLVDEEWDKVVDLNLNGTLYCIAAVLPIMRAQQSGTIINVSSWAGRFASRMAGPAYSTTKHAVIALTHSLNMEEHQNGIRGCALCPGEVATPLVKRRANPPTEAELSVMLQEDDVGETIAFVAGLPAHVCMNEILMSPVKNRSFGWAPG